MSREYEEALHFCSSNIPSVVARQMAKDMRAVKEEALKVCAATSELSHLRELVKEMREALSTAIVHGEIASGEYDGQVYQYCTSCGDNDIIGTVQHEDDCEWRTARTLIAKADAILKESAQ